MGVRWDRLGWIGLDCGFAIVRGAAVAMNDCLVGVASMRVDVDGGGDVCMCCDET